MLNRAKSRTLELVTKAEIYLKTDLRYITKGGFWLFLGQIASTGSALALSIVFANLTTKDFYGNYKYILSLSALLSVFTLNGIDTAIAQTVAKGKDGPFFKGLRTKISWGLIGSLCSFLAGIYYLYCSNQDLALSLFLIGLFLPLSEAFDIYNSVLQGRKLFKLLTIFNSATQIISSLIIAAALLFDIKVFVLIGVYFIAHTLINLICLIITLKNVKLNRVDNPDTINYGQHLSLMQVIGIIMAEIDKVIIFHFLGAASLAIYTFTTAPIDQLKGILKNISFIAFPRFANHSQENIKNNLKPKLIRIGILTTVIVIVYIATAPFLFKLLFKQYYSYVIYSQVFALSLIGVTMSMILYTFLESHGFKKLLYQYHIISNVIAITTLIPFTYFWGIWGAISARIIARSFLFLLSYWLVEKT